MKIVSREKIENCFEGDCAYKYMFDGIWTRDRIHALKALGQLLYYENYPRSMFQLICSDGSYIRGVEHTDECRVIYTSDEPDTVIKRFETRFVNLIDPY